MLRGKFIHYFGGAFAERIAYLHMETFTVHAGQWLFPGGNAYLSTFSAIFLAWLGPWHCEENFVNLSVAVEFQLLKFGHKVNIRQQFGLNVVIVLTLISLESILLSATGTFRKVVKGTVTLICDKGVFCASLLEGWRCPFETSVWAM